MDFSRSHVSSQGPGMASGKPSPNGNTVHITESCEFGESDDPDWVSLYPDERRFCSLSPVHSPRTESKPPEVEPVLNTCTDLDFPPPTRVLRRRLGNVDRHEERKKRLGKRKSCIVLEDGEEVKKMECQRQRKKVYVGELEKKLGNMSTAIEELNNLIGNENVSPRSQLPYLFQGTGEAPFNAPNESTTATTSSTGKTVRSRRRASKKGSWLRTARKLRRYAQNALLAFLCFMILFLPLKLGLHGVGLWLKGGGSSTRWTSETNRCPGYVDANPLVYGPANYKEIPRYVRGMEGSSKPGMGTGITHAGCKAGGTKTYQPTSNLSAHHNETTSPKAKPMEVKGKQTDREESRLESSGTVFTPGKCTQVFQYTAPRLRDSGSSNALRGNSRAEKRQSHVAVSKSPLKLHKKKQVPPMVVSVLPNRSSATGEIFVVVVVDGATYVTYSCSLPQQMIPTGP